MGIEINHVVIGGNLSRDVLFKQTPTGRSVSSLVVAANHTYLVNGEKRKETAFVDVDVWGPSAEHCRQYLKKGSPVVVTGRLKQELWQTQAGEKRSRLKIVAANVQFLPSREKIQVPVSEPDATAENFSAAWES